MPGPGYWQKLRPIFQLGKKRARLKVSAFNYPCGEQTKSCLSIIDSVTDSIGNTIPQFTTKNSKFTVDAWVKPGGFFGASEMALFGCYIGGGKYTFRLYLDNDYKLHGTLRHDASTNTDIKHDVRVDYDQWNHVGIAYDGTLAAPNPWSLWVNGVEKQTALTANTVQPLYTTGFQQFCVGPNYGIDVLSGAFKLDELRIWNVKKTASYFQDFRNARRAPSHTYGTDADCIAYYKFNEAKTPGIDQIAFNQYQVDPDTDSLQGDTAYIVTYDNTDGYPYSIGYSFIVATIPCAALAYDFSLKHPVLPPTGHSGYSMSISWTDANGAFKRRWLWKTSELYTGETEDIIYNGERILKDTAVFEFWCDLYAVNIIQTQDFYIDFSYISSPTSYVDSAQPDLTPTLTPTTSIYAPFPLTFPIMFTGAAPSL